MPRDPTGVPGLLIEVRERLRSRQPLDLLAYVSGLMAVSDARRRDPFPIAEAGSASAPTLGDLVRSFIGVSGVETAALLMAMKELTADHELRARIEAELGRRDDPLPDWLLRLRSATTYRSMETVHVLGDGENVLVGMRFADGHDLTALVFVDHNLGTVAKDGFVLDRPIAEIAAELARVGGRDTECRDIASAEARARLDEAIAHGAMMFPPFETETWPASRPLVEWIARALPNGGTGYVRPDWPDEAITGLMERFFASPYGAALEGGDHRELLGTILWYGTDYGPGDPMRWSPPAAEILLLDWIPRKIVAEVAHLSPAPDLLSAFVRFCDGERGIPGRLTAETVAAIESFAPEYQAAIGSPRLQGPAALLAAMAAIDPDDPGWSASTGAAFASFDYDAFVLADLSEAVGGDDALANLDDRPLPDESLEWIAIAADIREKVAEVLLLCDRCCDALLDAECRTACRRLLARIAVGDPRIFRRATRSETAAAAIVWIVGRANTRFRRATGPYVRDVAAHFGVSQGGLSQRAPTLLTAAGIPQTGSFDLHLGTPDLLVSGRRRDIIARRDRLRSDGGGL